MIEKIIVATTAIQEREGWHYIAPTQPDLTPLFIVAGIAIGGIIVSACWIFKKVAEADKIAQKNKNEQYKMTLDGLNKQLSSGKISEEKYAELLTDLEERYKRKWYE